MRRSGERKSSARSVAARPFARQAGPTVVARAGRRRQLLLILSALVLAGLLVYCRFFRPPPPLEIALWYWHQPFRVPAEERESLRRIGVRKLFVHAGDFRVERGVIHLVLPQRWTGPADGIEIHLVFRFDPSFVRALSSLDAETIVRSILPSIAQQRDAASAARLNVRGVQLDLDCPTSQLPKYADLMRRMRAALPAMTLSITALPTWYRSPKLEALLGAIDFAAPQFYEANTGRSREAYATIANPQITSSGIQAAGWRGAPFYAGIPAYGHTLVYTDRGLLAGVFHDMGLAETLRNPAFRLIGGSAVDRRGRPSDAAGSVGEDLYEVEALVDTSDGRGKGYRLLFEVPTPQMVETQLALLRRQRPANCLGAILFRYPEAQETVTLPLSSLEAVCTGRKPLPHLSVHVRRSAAPWELIETGRSAARPPTDVAFEIENDGNGSTAMGLDAIELTILLDRPGIGEIINTGADAVTTYAVVPGETAQPQLSSAARTNQVRLRCVYLGAHEKRRLAVLRLPADGARDIRVDWSARCPGGEQTVRGTAAK